MDFSFFIILPLCTCHWALDPVLIKGKFLNGPKEKNILKKLDSYTVYFVIHLSCRLGITDQINYRVSFCQQKLESSVLFGRSAVGFW